MDGTDNLTEPKQFKSLHRTLLKCFFTSTETVGLLGTGAQDVHLHFHTAPELWTQGVGKWIYLRWEAGIAQWLKRRTRDRKVAGSSTGRNCGRIHISGVNLLRWLLFRYPSRPRVTAVARKKSRPFCQKCRWQVTAKHTCILRMWFRIKWHCKLAHCWMVYTERAPRRQQFLVAPCSKQTVQWLLHWIFKTPCVKEQLLRTFS